MTNYIIGVDGGGSKTHAVLIDESGKVVAESFSGPANVCTDLELAYVSVTSAINDLIISKKLDSHKVRVGVGVAGYCATNDRQRDEFKLRLETNYQQVVVQSDCHIACLAAHGDAAGAIVSCGTGVVAYYIKDGIGKQIGGWGFPHGDVGGGAWIGLELCKLLCKAIDGVIPQSLLLLEIFKNFANDKEKYKKWLLNAKAKDYAEIAKLIIGYIDNDVNAKQVFGASIAEISQFIQAVKVTVGKLPIKLTGGLSLYYLSDIVKKFPNISISNMPAAFGAGYLLI